MKFARRMLAMSCIVVWVFCTIRGENVTLEGIGNKPADSTSTNTTLALSQFSMVLKTESEQRFTTEDFVVSKGQISAQWTASCRTRAKSTDEVCTIRAFDTYTDQITLEFLYTDAELYMFKRPVILAVEGRAHPKIHDFSTDAEEKSGEIVVRHGCSMLSRGIQATSQVTLSFPITAHNSMTLTWDKVCGYGQHEKLDYGWFAGSSESELRRPVSLAGRKESELPTFGPRTLSTRVYLVLKEGGNSQHFDAPMVSAEGVDGADAVGVEVRGANFGGMVQTGSYAVFDVMYNCVGKGVSRVRAVVGIAPFDALQVGWRKDCGGGVAKRVQVGNIRGMWGKRGRVGDVVENGTAVEGFTEMSGKSGEKRIGMFMREFFLWTVDGEEEEFGEISAHSNELGIGRVGIREESGEVVKVWVRCLKRGKVKIRVTVTVRDRLPVEWWFVEQCMKRERGGVRRIRVTAGMVVYLSVGMFGVMVVAWIFRGVSGGQKGYGNGNIFN